MRETAVRSLVAKLGPGMLMAGAAVGVSHLVQSTRAGIELGALAILIVVATNLLKYPFFEYGHRFAAATGDNLLQGYDRLGKKYLWLFLALNVVTAIGSVAVLAFVTAALLKYLLFPDGALAVIAGVVLGACWLILTLGHYRWLQSITKALMLVLSVATVLAAVMAGLNVLEGAVFTPRMDMTSMAGLSFIIALMGWMPGPMEISVWQSLWVQAENRRRGASLSSEEARFDFRVGYYLTIVLAVLFVCLGMFTLQGKTLPDKPADFAGAVITMYGEAIGGWAVPVIAVAAVAAIFSTTFTLMDAYPRSLSNGLAIAWPRVAKREKELRLGMGLAMIACALPLISRFSGGFRLLIDAVTIIAFLAAPYVAWLNMRCVRRLDARHRPGKGMMLTAKLGMVYLLVFGGVYIIVRWW